ncbi:MAG: hypothetical protein A2042_01755 [Candidatus Schekmanbacteria bacterium GWA2_38_11]|uniref:Ribbon-helix-helix protein CopG domain-containing protein n=1 Tax=Candidatus Schekmanbacteria bacterium GWA2_38_11 TaxID=1817876 RepID=A0A1F7RD05_9BACT|nr:MAG: hypothetical protein A2042_01755 [Candidatus Schekmanbacteria bacterium GWA2_38_11]
MAYKNFKRIGISLPDSTLKKLKQLVPERKRSEYITRALEEKLNEEKRKRIQDEMIKGYQTNDKEDANMAEEWFHIEEESYNAINQATDKQEKKKLKSRH